VQQVAQVPLVCLVTLGAAERQEMLVQLVNKETKERLVLLDLLELQEPLVPVEILDRVGPKEILEYKVIPA